jgi:hypothetical protein
MDFGRHDKQFKKIKGISVSDKIHILAQIDAHVGIHAQLTLLLRLKGQKIYKSPLEELIRHLPHGLTKPSCVM